MKSLYKATITFGTHHQEMYFVASSKEEIWGRLTELMAEIDSPTIVPEEGFAIKVVEETPLSKIRGM